ncbi:MAG: PQQ-dependent sugar dehydrogenase [Winogradskyella sp.]
MRTLATLLSLLSLTLTCAQDLTLDLFVSNLDRPVNIKHAGDDKLYVAEQDGRIKVINADGTVESTLFLDIDDRVINSGNERGLLGLAFHPDYATNGFFFVNYSNNSGNTVIARFSRSTTNPLVADPNSELIILSYTQPFSNHNGGELAFGSDGYLYISSGDGGSGGDPQDNSQNLSNLLGKLLRIDVNNSSEAAPYAIPTDNPFVSNAAAQDEIWSYGLRNPWKFSFDRDTNDLWIGDVGQNAREEINLTPATDTGGLNYGWRCYEGNITFNTTNCPPASNLTFPVAEYAHTGGRCSITGGYIYRGTNYPNLQGAYFFADICTQEIGYLQLDNGIWTSTFENFSGTWVAFGEAVDGELLVASLSGAIYKIVDSALSINENALNAISVFPNPAKNELHLDFSNTTIQISSIVIYDIQGKAVKNILRNNQTIQTIKVSDLSKGIYIMKMKSINGTSSTQKLILN